MALNSNALKDDIKAALISNLGVDLNDPRVQEANISNNLEQLSKSIAEAVVNHIRINAVVSFAPGNITGVCPSGGGPLSVGTGTNGRVT